MLSKNSIGDSTTDSGILIDRGSNPSAFMGWDNSDNQFIMGTTSATEISVNVDENYSKGTLSVNLLGNVNGSIGEITPNTGTFSSITSIGPIDASGQTIQTAAITTTGNITMTGKFIKQF
jgi:hypothetical protein